MTSIDTTSTEALAGPVSIDRLIASIDAAPDASEWIRAIRAAAAKRAGSLGLPTKRDEEWRYTNPAPILETEYTLQSAGESDASTPVETLGIESAATLVFIDGRYAPAISSVPDIAGVTIETIDGTPRRRCSNPWPPAPSTTRATGSRRLGPGSLDRARASGSPRARRSSIPSRSCSAPPRARTPILTAPSVVVLAEEGAHARIFEDHQGADGARGLTLGRTEIRAQPHANIDHTTLLRDPDTRHHVSTLRVIQQRESTVKAARVLLGGAIVRNNIHATIEGERCETALPGVFVPEHTQHHDTHIRVEHLAENCHSRQHYRGVLADRSRGVFTGRIYVKDIAQKTDAIQHNSNLLISPDARVTTKPQLEIYADDVRCTHGATSGQLDDDALFYLRSRGVPEPTARLLLTHAFVGDTIDRIGHEGIRDEIRRIIQHRLDAALTRVALVSTRPNERSRHEHLDRVV